VIPLNFKTNPRTNTMDYRNLFGIAAIILSSAVFVQSLNSANAFPQGANVSLGSNPIEHHYGVCTQADFFLNSTNNPFIITDIIGQTQGGYDLTLYVNGAVGAKLYSSTENVFYGLKSGIVVDPGEAVYCSGGTTRIITITGYYAHP
jgi:hypothetical protein